jgi:hypothetical protein
MKLALNAFLVWDPNLNYTYDPHLSYGMSIAGLRNLRTNMNITPTSTFPLFAYNRSTLQLQPGMRKITATAPLFKVAGQTSVVEYTATLAEFQMQWLYIHQDVQAIERFEILYNSYRATNETRKVVLNLQELGAFDYTLWWSDLYPDIQTSTMEGGYYKAVGGTVTIKGPFLAVKSTAALIKYIQENVYSNEALDAIFKWEIIMPTDIDDQNDIVRLMAGTGTWPRGRVQFSTLADTDVLPGPLVTNKYYYIVPVDDTHIQLSETLNGSVINITDQGTVADGNYFIMRARI